MDPITIGIGTKLIGSAISGIQGLIQGGKARKLAKKNIRPEYEIPKEIEQNLRMAKTRANNGLSSAEYGKAINGIWRNRNAALASAQDRRGGLSAVSTTNQLANDATTSLDVADARERKDNERFLMGQNQVMAGYKDKAWDYNKRQKFMENADAIRALYGASRENGKNALNGLMSAGQDYAFGGSGGFGNGSKRSYGNGEWNPGWRSKKRTPQDWTDYED